MRTAAFLALIAAVGLVRGSAVAQESAASAAAAAQETPTAVSLFDPGTLSAVFAEEPTDTDWARATEERIVAEVERQSWPGLTRVEIECRSSVCAVLFVYSGRRDVERKIREQLRKAIGFAGFRSASTVLPDAAVSEVLFFR